MRDWMIDEGITNPVCQPCLTTYTRVVSATLTSDFSTTRGSVEQAETISKTPIQRKQFVLIIFCKPERFLVAWRKYKSHPGISVSHQVIAAVRPIETLPGYKVCCGGSRLQVLGKILEISDEYS
jgi:type IV secretory pathway protease TraF